MTALARAPLAPLEDIGYAGNYERWTDVVLDPFVSDMIESAGREDDSWPIGILTAT